MIFFGEKKKIPEGPKSVLGSQVFSWIGRGTANILFFMDSLAC